MSETVSTNYAIYNTQKSKRPVIVVVIEGLNDILSSAPVYTELEYGDPVEYGDAGLTYGGLRYWTNETASGGIFRDILSLEGSSATIGQTLEPEQGKSSISQLTLGFIDKDGFMTKLCAPGVLIPDLLGANIQVLLGFSQISYPQDYLTIFRGVVTGINAGPGLITLSTSDPTVKKNTQIFYCAQTELIAAVAPTDTTITVTATAQFFTQITGPDGTQWPASGVPKCFCYIIIDDETIEVQPDPVITTQFNVIKRGARGTTAAAHDLGATVNAAFQLGATTDPTTSDPSGFSDPSTPPNPINAMDLALMVMLSGWNGPWISGIDVLNIYAGYIQLEAGVDAVDTYNLVTGDYLILTGSAHAGNNGVYLPIYRFATGPDGTPNNLIYFTGTLTPDLATAATVGFRSQYDVLPTAAGLGLTPQEVDVAEHQYVATTWLGQAGNDLQFYFAAPEANAKNWMEAQVYLPVGAYTLTKRGLLSCGFTAPPLGAQGITYLTPDNILDPSQIIPQRATNNRAFFNEIDVSFNPDDQGDFLQLFNVLDADSYSQIGILSVLPFPCNGVLNFPANVNQIQTRVNFLLYRYGKGATILNVKVNWEKASTIEAGDIVAIQDDGSVLQISNFTTGERGLGTALFEVVGKTFDLHAGNATLKLINGLGSNSTDRFGVISPSSLIAPSPASTTTELYIEDSFGALYPGNESLKWADYVGQTIAVHNADQSSYQTCKLVSIDSSNNYLLHVTGLTSAPSPGFIIDIDQYPTSADPTTDELYKNAFAFLDPTVTVVSGVSTSSFTVASGDASLFLVGAIIRVHSTDYSTDSGEVIVESVSGTTITTTAALGFTPSAGQLIDLIGFADKGYPYRWI